MLKYIYTGGCPRDMSTLCPKGWSTTAVSTRTQYWNNSTVCFKPRGESAHRLKTMMVDVGQHLWRMSTKKARNSSLGDAGLLGRASHLARETFLDVPTIGIQLAGFAWRLLHTMGFAAPLWISNLSPQMIRTSGQ